MATGTANETSSLGVVVGLVLSPWRTICDGPGRGAPAYAFRGSRSVERVQGLSLASCYPDCQHGLERGTHALRSKPDPSASSRSGEALLNIPQSGDRQLNVMPRRDHQSTSGPSLGDLEAGCIHASEHARHHLTCRIETRILGRSLQDCGSETVGS